MMTRFFVLVLAAAAATASGQVKTKPGKPAPDKKAAPAKTKAEPAVNQVKWLEIPAKAVEFEPGFFRYTDASGKKWLYRRTPFGVSRWEDSSLPKAEVPAVADYLRTTDLGDSVGFERTTPWGLARWERKKTELDASERAAWERDQARAARQDKQE